MKKTAALALALCLLTAIPAAAGGVPKILEFDTMAPVVAPFLNPNNPIRGVNGGGVPWQIAAAEGELKIDGTLEISVRGLVIVATGVNPSPTFRGIVSCLSSDGAGNMTTVNVTTGEFPATTTGDSDIEAVINVPDPCFAPIIFVTNSAGTRWFAVTGK